MKAIPMMPEEYKGQETKGGGYTKTAPRKWTKQEVDWVERMVEQGYSYVEIAESIDRTAVSVQIKVKRLSKKDKTYNAKHVDEKYKINSEFVHHINPQTLLDVYAGDGSFYEPYCGVIANDKNEQFKTTYHLDALKFCCRMYEAGGKFDIVDLDPFGSAYDCFDLAIKMAQKGLVVTFGEMGHKRWKRLDYVQRYYGIDSLETFTLDRLIEHVQMIGRRNKKQLTVYAQREWRNIGRVWFEIEPIKITEQWSGRIDVGDGEAVTIDEI